MPESRPKGGEASRRPPEPDQLGAIRDLIKELAPSPEEAEKGKSVGRALPNMRSRGFTGQDGTFFHVLVTSHERIPRPDNPKTFGFINVLNYDSQDKNTLFSQHDFYLDSEGDPADDENLRLRQRGVQISFNEKGAAGANIERVEDLIDALILARDTGTIIE